MKLNITITAEVEVNEKDYEESVGITDPEELEEYIADEIAECRSWELVDLVHGEINVEHRT